MRKSLYWDDFQRRSEETVSCIKYGDKPPVRRVSIFITENCNMKCKYCNHSISKQELNEYQLNEIIERYGSSAILHITGGEPSTVPWLYPYIKRYGNMYKFHLNTNALIMPPAKFLKRLKISLDSCDKDRWNSLVGRNAFDKVLENIKNAAKETNVTVTYTMTKESYRDIPKFLDFASKELKDVYAIFFSVYKGKNKKFAFNKVDAEYFYKNIKPLMDSKLDEESKALLNETMTEKHRIMQGVRFPENNGGICYLSLSERVFLPDGSMSYCSHLVRDGVKQKEAVMHEKCKYGCNRRLVKFNDHVKKNLNGR